MTSLVSEWRTAQGHAVAVRIAVAAAVKNASLIGGKVSGCVQRHPSGSKEVCGSKVYSAVFVTVSGAVHHLAGMQKAGTVIAINPDKDAPIFEYADFGIVAEFA